MQEEQVQKSNQSAVFGKITEETTRTTDPKGIEYMIIDDDDGYTD